MTYYAIKKSIDVEKHGKILIFDKKIVVYVAGA